MDAIDPMDGQFSRSVRRWNSVGSALQERQPSFPDSFIDYTLQAMKLQAPIPLFRIFDLSLAKKFYCDWLGFTVDWEHQFAPHLPHYVQISRDATVLHLTEHYGDCTPGSKIFIHVDDVRALHQELHTRPNPNMNPGVETAPWNALTMEVIDPFGNRICFNQSLAS